ncbi:MULTISPECIES: ClbS/DfsB family four-helix bundle protein [Leuconostoc]|uniref:ClbS/DfsB family four-helix bundle protein n=1 Tax=Leuconostoc TaxID=1243 RepID=UPI0002465E45|nr:MULTISPECIES: ClbS/DfsB family four-helix bundle protein [Leuconostoc]ETI99788.1 MAG: hypothetical protein Q611_LSC00216G0001 [Leuconostoc sp. DORA_2]KAF0260293.1 ClbS/DfsB family four-helix bundle protein [Leuconostoc citreum]MBA5938657.1 ClbS/DfsB family four-helix bundle protein [Leuconostoc citreum]MBE4726479.1 ClbS/DfsB family four-helix bundle protein [Leuconostoc citreum]MBU7451346.1 ClbS/DfsB family four-helix bundle protein [Leuconostoc citreum]
MQTYDNKTALLNAIQSNYAKYINEFETIPNALQDKRIDEVDRTPSENLAYQLGWLTAILRWESDELSGKKAEVPAPGYNWGHLGDLYQSFYQTYADMTLEDKIVLLNQRVSEICDMITRLPDEVLFEANQRDWAYTKAQWPVWKWLHINTVAPFKTFRTKIRKWKKVALS